MQERLLLALDNPLKISYHDLVGTGMTPRAKAPCDGLVQASISAQNASKDYIDNWSSDGFVRWAECLGFINYHSEDDSFSLTSVGRDYALSVNERINKDILIDRMFSYSPALRVLGLLYDKNAQFLKRSDANSNIGDDSFIHSALSKYEIGSLLGFNGENGFTSYSKTYINQLVVDLPADLTHSKIRSDIEGSSDKYVCMIATWLEKLGLVEKVQLGISDKKLNAYYMRSQNKWSAHFKPDAGTIEDKWYLSHGYQITTTGVRMYEGRVIRTGQYGSWRCTVFHCKAGQYNKYQRLAP